MKIEEQVLTIEQMQHLKELGVEVKDTALSWTKYPVYEIDGKLGWRWRVVISEDGTMCKDGLNPTFTLQEILESLPKSVNINGTKYIFGMLSSGRIWYFNPVIESVAYDAITENILLTAYKMLCWVLEHGYLNKE